MNSIPVRRLSFRMNAEPLRPIARAAPRRGRAVCGYLMAWAYVLALAMLFLAVRELAG